MGFRVHSVAGALIMAASLVIIAPSSPRAQESRNEVTVAVGAATSPTYDGSDDYTVTPGALVRGKIEGFRFFSRGTNLLVDLIREPDTAEWDLGAGPIASVRRNRAGRIKDDQVKALGELDTAWEVGGWAGLAKTGALTSAYDNLSFRVSYVTDAGSAHKSYVITPAVEYVMPVSEATLLGFSISADYVGKGFGRYYFDIDSTGSQASGLNIYAGGGKAGFAKYNIGLLAAHSLSGDLRKGWSLFAGGGHGRILGRYARSPIVRDAGSRSQWMAGAGIAYSF